MPIEKVLRKKCLIAISFLFEYKFVCPVIVYLHLEQGSEIPSQPVTRIKFNVLC